MTAEGGVLAFRPVRRPHNLFLIEGVRMKRLALAIALVAMVGACKKAGETPAVQPAATDTSKMMADTSKHMMADTGKMAAPTKTTPTPTKTKRP